MNIKTIEINQLHGTKSFLKS